MAYNSVVAIHGTYSETWIEVFMNLAIQNECYKPTSQCWNILTLVPVCTVVLR